MVAGYAWVVDGTAEVEAVALSSLFGIAAKGVALAQIAAGYSWVADDITGAEREALSYIDSIAAKDLALVGVVVGYSWVADDITEDERRGLSNLNGIAANDLGLAETAAAYAWVADDIAGDELWALGYIGSIGEKDLALAQIVAAYAWVVDDMTSVERWTLSYLDGIAAEDPALANVVTSYSWVADDIAEYERWALLRLNALAEKDLALADVVAHYPWVTDDMTWAKYWTLRDMDEIALADLALATAIAGYSWVADDLTEAEQRAIGALAQIHGLDPTVARTVAGLAWVVDDMTSIEQRAVESLYRAAASDRAYAQTIIGLAWMVDDITEAELRALDSLNAATPETARLLLDMARPPAGLVDDPSQWDIQLLGTLAGLGQDTFEELAEVPWFAYGVDDEEEALLQALPAIRHASRSLYDDLLHTWYTQSATISLPLAGVVDLWVFQPKAFPPGENVVEILEGAVRITEGFIGAPFPTTQVILLVPIVGPETDHGIGGGGHWGRFITVARHETLPSPITAMRGAIYHEVAHYYFGGGIGPPWLVEGGAEFMFSYTSVQAGVMSPEEQKLTHRNWVEAGCVSRGMRNIKQLNERQRESDSFIHCNYNLGGFFLLTMFETLGEEAMGAAIRELYLLSVSERRPVTEEEIYQTLLKHTPAHRQGRFRIMYRRWHGGSFADEPD